MTAKVPKNITDLAKDELEDFLDSFDVVLTDCDGVLWLHNQVIDGSNDAINRFIDMGKEVYFITNNSTKTRLELAEKARKLDFQVETQNMVSVAYLAAQYLKRQNFSKKAFIVGDTGISGELDAAGIRHLGVGPDVLDGNLNTLVKQKFIPDPEVGAVVVGFDEHISFPKIMKAATYLDNKDTIFVATNTDERLPMPTFVIPETGAIVRAIETCAERKATIMGKPESFLCDIMFGEDCKANSDRYLMIGDRLNTDILFGAKNHFQTLFVESGVHSMDRVYNAIAQAEAGMHEEETIAIPDYYVPKIANLFI